MFREWVTLTLDVQRMSYTDTLTVTVLYDPNVFEVYGYLVVSFILCPIRHNFLVVFTEYIFSVLCVVHNTNYAMPFA